MKASETGGVFVGSPQLRNADGTSQDSPSPSLPRPRIGDRFHVTTWVVVIAVVIGAILRILGAAWGLPANLHTDERVVVLGAIDLAQRSSFEPTVFLRPDHVEIMLSSLAYSAYALFNGQSVEVMYQANPSTFFLISRLITAVFGTAAIVLAALIGWRFAPAVGAIAAVLFAVFPPFVLHAHFATPDIPLIFAVLALMLALMHYISRPDLPSLLAASAAVSLAIAIKYPGAISAIMIAVVVGVCAWRDRRLSRIVSHGLTAIAGVVVFLFLISPVLFTNITGVITAIRRESRATHPGADGLGWGGNLLYYATEIVTTTGILVIVLAVIGVFFAIRMRALVALPLGLGAVFWIGLSSVPLHWERWALPMYLTPLLLAAVGAWYGYRFVGQRWPRWQWRQPLAIAVIALIGLHFAAGSAASLTRLLVPDTRPYSAQAYIDLGITPTSAIDEGYSPFVHTRALVLFDDFRWDGDALVAVDESKEFVLLSSCTNDRFFQEDRYVEERAVYDAIRSQFDLLLDVNIIPERQNTGIEVWDTVSALSETVALANGGLTGCDLEVYRITP